MSMIELDNYLNYCNTQYQNSNPCNCDDDCANSNYCQKAEVNCYKCIKRVHDYDNSRIHYNCPKMMYNYVLKHSYRFAAEIFYQFGRIQSKVSKWDDIYITSIGCGPCTELFGALLQWRIMGKQDSHFHFRGFDLEPMWKPLISQVPTFFNNADVQVYVADVFESYASFEERIDVVVLNYMLSDMLKFKKSEFGVFLSHLSVFIQHFKPKFVLVNDVYLKVSTSASEQLINVLSNKGFVQNCVKIRYKGLKTYIGEFGEKIEREPFNMPNKAIIDKYDPFDHVDSIQTIIEIRNDTQR